MNADERVLAMEDAIMKHLNRIDVPSIVQSVVGMIDEECYKLCDERDALAEAYNVECEQHREDVAALETVIHNAGIAMRFERPRGAFGQSMENTIAHAHLNALISAAIAIETRRQEETGYRWDGAVAERVQP